EPRRPRVGRGVQAGAAPQDRSLSHGRPPQARLRPCRARSRRLGRDDHGRPRSPRTLPRVSLQRYRVARDGRESRVGSGENTCAMMTPAEAARVIVDHVRPLPAERRPLRAALDAVLAEDVASPIDLPPWDNSAMDGYAVRSADLKDTATELEVIETIPAGRFPQKTVGAAQATRIFTGAPMPQGADTVIRQEDTAQGSNGTVTIRNAPDVGKNIRRRGEDIRKGAVVLPAGTALGPAQLGVLASIAWDAPLVHRPERVAFMGSGDEIVDLDQKQAILAGTKFASSNSYTLDALIRRSGAEPVNLGVARDSKESLREHLRGAAGADLLVTTAGVSVG